MVYSNSDPKAIVNKSTRNFLLFSPLQSLNYKQLQPEEEGANEGPEAQSTTIINENDSKSGIINVDCNFKKPIVEHVSENIGHLSLSEINDTTNIVDGAIIPDTFCRETVSLNNIFGGGPPNNNNNSNSQSNVSSPIGECSKPFSNSNSSSSSGGLLSFFGFKFNKSSTRHLDRSSSQGDSVDKASEPVLASPNRYTKFPLIGNSSGLLDSNDQQQSFKTNQSHDSLPSSCSSSSSKSTDKTSSGGNFLCLSNASSSSVPPQSNSPFDISQIQLTAQTKVYTNPNRSPSRVSRKGTPFSASTFLTSAISSLGKKTGNNNNTGCGTTTTKSSTANFINRLKVKSKSDNNLHRVDLNSSASNNAALASIGSGNLGSISSRGRQDITTRVTASSSQNIYNPEPSSELRLNSVQIGDHATILLPWTGFQRNNLSSVTSTRVHQNTHRNNFDAESVRYVECGFNNSNENSHQSSSSRLPTTSSTTSTSTFTHSQKSKNNKKSKKLSKLSSTNYSSCTVTKRRSKSLERDYNFRIFHDLVATSSLSSSGGLREKSSKNSFHHQTNKWSLERKHPAENNRIRHSLTPDEQEILLRNIKWDCFSTSSSEVSIVPPPRPEKPSSLKSSSSSISRFSNAPRCLPTSSFKSLGESSLSKPPACKPKKPPPIGVIQRSAPNSFSTSSDSNESVNYSVPPSPPPRPLASLKPESRLIAQGPTLPAKKIQKINNINTSVVRSNSFIVATTTSNNNTSGGGFSEVSSDSGVSHTSYSSSTCNKKTCGGEEIERVPIRNPYTTTDNSPSSSSSSLFSQKTFDNLAMSIEEARNSGFINKPSKGWLHSDQLLSREGVTYTVRYIGCLDVNTSMKSLDFDTRSLIAKECINQVCEAAGLKSADRKRKIDRQVMRILGLRPRLDHAGCDVHLTITSTCLKLTSLDTGAVIAVHDMPNISFASGGDATMLDFIAYVAKDSVVGRACFILECGSGLAQDVIITVGQAFELRFKEYIQRRPPPPRLPTDDREYYNDLPGKLPPDVSKGGEASKSDKDARKPNTTSKLKEPPSLTLPASDRELSVNLIDFEAPTPPAFGPSSQDRHLLLSPDTPNFATTSESSSSTMTNVGTGLGLPNSPSQPLPLQKDPFDMQPFAGELPKPLSGPEQRKLLETQSWFHGAISRNEAEILVQNDGDFLVRESQTTAGQYVLTGLQNGTPKHLLLVDPEGVVRTKDQTFDSVIHLIQHHSENSLPIISAESLLVILRNPIENPSTNK